MAWSWLEKLSGRPWRRPAKAPSPPVVEAGRSPLKISAAVLDASGRRQTGAGMPLPWTLPEPPPGTIPKGASTMAQDSGVSDIYGWANEGGGLGGIGLYSEGLFFPGYPYLAQLTQRSEYRRGSEIVAREMTRKWIRLTAKGDKGKSGKLDDLEGAMKDFKVQSRFREAAELDGFFGRGHIFPDTEAATDLLQTPLIIDPVTIKKGSLKRLTTVEPLWTYPTGYDSSNPLSANFYKPQGWYVQGQHIHTSRLLTFVGREVPDILKPAYLFGGISLSQLGKPYVDNWLETRSAVARLVRSFSQSGLKTNMQAALSAQPGQGILDRIKLFNNFRDNSDALILDKESEEWFNISTPLGTLDALQAQTQEHMASVWGIPLIVFFGITPSGLNASSDGELEVWNTTIKGLQEHLFGDRLDALIKIIQLNEFGAIDPDIGYEWNHLGETDDAEAAVIRKSDGDLAVARINAGVLAPIEERTRIANEDDSQYPDLDVVDVPVAPVDPTLDPPDDGTDPPAKPNAEAEPV